MLFEKRIFYAKELLNLDLSSSDFLEKIESKIHEKTSKVTVSKLTTDEKMISEILFCDGIVLNSGFVGYLTQIDFINSNDETVDYVLKGFRKLGLVERANILELACKEYLIYLPSFNDDNEFAYFHDKSDRFSELDTSYYDLEPDSDWGNLGQSIKEYVEKNSENFYV